MDNSSSGDQYEHVSHEYWSEQAVTDLRDHDSHQLYLCLRRIMQSESLDDTWKVHFAIDLLEEESIRSRRARIWGALSALARGAPLPDLAKLASIAWSFIDSLTSDDDTNLELSCVQEFLDDVRIFTYDWHKDAAKIASQVKSESRFAVFTAFRPLCLHQDFASAGERALELTQNTDFVLREAAVNGICTIYTRSDCDPAALGSLRQSFSETLAALSADDHWYVRRANSFAMFFRDQFDKEYDSAAE